MVIKTDVCAFTEYRIYPGHGCRFVRRDGQILYFINAKAKLLHGQSIKPAKLTWTQAWRRLHKKAGKEDGLRARKRRVVRVARPVAGMSADELQKKRKEAPSILKSAAEKDAADRAAKAEAKKARKAAAAAAPKQKAPAVGKAAQKATHATKGR